MSDPPPLQQILEAIRAERPKGVKITRIPSGKASTGATLAVMLKLTKAGSHNPALVHLSREIVRGLPSKDYEGEVRRIFDWVYKHVRYTQDPRALEWLQTPTMTAWVIGQGDCDDHAMLIASLALALGHGAAFRVVATDATRPKEASHVYALVGIRSKERGDTWIAGDTTQDHPMGWEPPEERVFGTWDFVAATV